MNRTPSPLALAVVGAMSVGLAGCFGGSSTSGSSNDAEAAAVSGTAAADAPLAGAEVCLSTSDQAGCAATTTTDENGQYSFSDSGPEAASCITSLKITHAALS